MPRFTATLDARGAGRLVEVPLDVRALFGQARAQVKATVNGHEDAKREDTRRRRVAKAIEMLRTGVKTPG